MTLDTNFAAAAAAQPAADHTALIITSVTTLLVALLGIGGTLMASTHAARSLSNRALRESKSAAIIGLLDLWGSMLKPEFDGVRIGLERTELGSASARLFLNLRKREATPVMRIVNYTSSMFMHEHDNTARAAHIGSAQDVLQAWHLGKLSARKALSTYREQLHAIGYTTPVPPSK